MQGRCIEARIRLLSGLSWDCPVARPTLGKRSCFQCGRAGKNRFPSAEVYVIGRHVAKGFVIALAVVVVDEAGDLPFQGHQRLPDLQEHALFAGAVIPLDLAVGVWMVRAGQDVA